MVVSGPTRLERVALEFARAGRRGLSRRELKRVAGPRFQDVLDELAADGYLVVAKFSQFDHRPWRWTAFELPSRGAAPAGADAPEPPVVEPDPQLVLPVVPSVSADGTSPDPMRSSR